MPSQPTPKTTLITRQRTLVGSLCCARPVRVLAAALVVVAIAGSPTPARAASVLSGGGVSPTIGSTATAFGFSVHYTSTDNPARPAQAVWAQVGSVTVSLTKVDGSAHDGTWQGTSTLPAGTWEVTFKATTSGDSQPQPLPGPMITVTEPPPPPPPPLLPPSSQPTATASPSPSPTPSASGSPPPTPPTATADGASPGLTPGSSDPPAGDPDTPRGSMLASFLIIGGSMSIAGAALLARQWNISRKPRH